MVGYKTHIFIVAHTKYARGGSGSSVRRAGRGGAVCGLSGLVGSRQAGRQAGTHAVSPSSKPSKQWVDAHTHRYTPTHPHTHAHTPRHTERNK